MTQDQTIMDISTSELQHLAERPLARRSDAYRFLEKNFQHLIQLKVGTADGASWNETAALMSRRGYLNANGLALNGDTVRRMFRRVEQDIRRREADAVRETAKSFPTRPRNGLLPRRPATEIAALAVDRKDVRAVGSSPKARAKLKGPRQGSTKTNGNRPGRF
jgi:hypothetical protein